MLGKILCVQSDVAIEASLATDNTSLFTLVKQIAILFLVVCLVSFKILVTYRNYTLCFKSHSFMTILAVVNDHVKFVVLLSVISLFFMRVTYIV